MKFMLASDSPKSPTGFAGQMKAIARCLIDENHDVEYLGWQNNVGEKFVDGDYEYDVHPSFGMNPQQDEIFGRKVYPKYFKELDPEAIISLGDAWMVDRIPEYDTRPLWIMYFPIDGHPLNNNIKQTVMKSDVPIAMSKFGQDICMREGIPVSYIPHQLDFNLFDKYNDKKVKNKFRKTVFPEVDENTVIFGSIARANPRKHHMRLMRAFEIFVRENNLTPEDVRLYLHCDPFDVMYQTRLNAHDYFFVEFAQTLGIDKFIIYPDLEGGYSHKNGYTEEKLRATMSAIDVHVNATGGEGFGVPTLETMAMGIPQIITDYTTSEELIAHKDPFTREKYDDIMDMRGLLIEPKMLYMENSNVNKAWVNVEQFASALETYYNDVDLRKIHGQNGNKFARKYDEDKINKKWIELVNKIPKVIVQ